MPTAVRRCSLIVLCGRWVVDRPCAISHLPIIVPENAKDGIFVTDILPYMVVKGVVLSGVAGTSHSVGR